MQPTREILQFPRRPRATAVLALACAILPACGDRDGGDGESPPRDGSPAAPSAGGDGTAQPARDRAITAVTTKTLAEEIIERDRKELLRAGWTSEARHEAASKRLYEIAHFIESAGREARDAVASFVAAEYRGTALRPEPLDVVYESREYSVRRARGDPPEDAAGPRGFLESLDALVSPLRDANSIRVKFKPFRVQETASGFETVSYFEACGRGDDAVSQQTAVWRCRWRAPSPRDAPVLLGISVESFEEVSRSSPPQFRDATQAVAGEDAAWVERLRYSVDHWRQRIERRRNVFVFGHQGLAIGDADGDGDDDLYVCQPGCLPNVLWIRQDDGTVVDRAREAGVDYLDYTRAALFLDLDNDGDQDLVVGIPAGLLVLQNLGNGRFEERGAVREAGGAFSLSAADYNADGFLDVYVARYSPSAEQGEFPAPLPYHDANNGRPNVMLRNDGDLVLRDVTAEVGLDENNRRFSFASAWEDYDGDGDVDLYVANDFGRNNLYRNVEGRFRDAAAEAGVEDISAGMSVSFGDFDADGRPDIYVSNMFSSAGGRIAFQRRFKKGADERTLSQFQRHARGNTLFRNLGDGTFADVSVEEGVTLGRWAWGSRLVDIDNDGLDDVVVANGQFTGTIPDDL